MLQFRRGFTRVCLVAESSLAEAYLRKLLRDYPELHSMSLRQFVRLSPLQRAKAIYVIDLCGLEVPLFECLRELRARCPSARFLLLGNDKSKQEILRLVTMGAHGYIPYSAVPRTLARAIFSIAGDRLWVPHEIFREFLREAASALQNTGHSRNTITTRESQILELVRRRMSNREIAVRLQIRVSTVKFHLSNILSKLYVRSRSDLMEIPSGQVSRALSSF
jgi:DNA-binding NarL/FixJ family response regulator